MRHYFRALLWFFLPSAFIRLLWKGAPSIGFSLVICRDLNHFNNRGGKIGHFNLIKVESISMGKNARIGHFNRIRDL